MKKNTCIISFFYMFIVLSSSCSVSKKVYNNNKSNIIAAEKITAGFQDAFGQHLQINRAIKVRLKNTSAMVNYSDVTNMLYVTPFELLKKERKSFFESYHRTSKHYPSAKSAYDDLVFNYWLSHQLVHILLRKLQVPYESTWERELQTNVLALLFLEDEKQLYPQPKELINYIRSLNEDLAEILKKDGIRLENITPDLAFTPKKEEVSWFYRLSNILEAQTVVKESRWLDLYKYAKE